MFASALAVLAAASPAVDAQVVDRAGRVVGPREVRVKALKVRADGRTCRVRAGLPIGVLRALRVPFKAEGACSSLYVFEARGQRERGAGGWVYKVGRKLPGVSASARRARLRSGQRVTWFWCKQAGNCQRTLETSVVPELGTLRITVRSYDDRGRGRPAGGVSVGVSPPGSDAIQGTVTAPDGTATMGVPAGRYVVTAVRDGLIPAFPETVTAR